MPGDTVVFSSKTIPGNEKAVGAVINNLARRGISIITGDQAAVHTSGHPRQEELRQFYQWLQPQLVVPMHGEAWHLQSSCGVCAVLWRARIPPSSTTDKFCAWRPHHLRFLAKRRWDACMSTGV